MPVEFLSDAEATGYCRFDGDLSREDLDRVFFLDDADRELIESRRGDHNRLGFALQLGTVRWLGAFLSDPTDVPPSVLGYVAGQLEVSDPACVGRYLERRRTRFEHAAEIKAACGLREFAQIQREFELWLDARAWMTGDGPRAIFSDAIDWLREREVLLPGVTTLARLVARARAETDERLWTTLSGVPSAEQARVLDQLLDVPEGVRVSGLERWRKGPAEPTGKNLRLALARVAEIRGVGIDATVVRALVPARRLVDVARYGMAAKAPALRRHPAPRRLATLVATVVHLSASSIDDCLELFDLLMVTELLGKAQRETEKQRAAAHPRLARASAKLAAAVSVLLEASVSGEPIRVADVWRSIELVVPRAELGAALATVHELVPSVDVDDEGETRARLADRIRLVSGFIRPLGEVIDFGANAEGAGLLGEMRRMPQLLAARKLRAADIDERLVHGSWRRLVYGHPPPADGAVDKNAYVFCVLTQFHRRLLRRDIYAPASSRWRDPRALLLDGQAWANAKQPVLNALSLPENPDRLLAEHARVVDGAYREVAGRLQDSSVTVDEHGKLHLGLLDPVEEPPGQIELRQLIRAMLPRVSVPEVILEVMAWEPRCRRSPPCPAAAAD